MNLEYLGSQLFPPSYNLLFSEKFLSSQVFDYMSLLSFDRNICSEDLYIRLNIKQCILIPERVIVFRLETDELTEDEWSRQGEMLHDTIVHCNLRVVKYSSKCLVKHVARTK